MIRKCPHCGSGSVRRSAVPPAEASWRDHFLSPYRCRECMLQFRVISRKAYVAGAYVAVAIAAATAAVFLLDWMIDPTPSKGLRRSEGWPQQRVHVAALPAAGALDAARTLATP